MDLEAVERVYRRFAPAYDFYFGKLFQPGRRAVIQRMNCRPGERILEVGVGTGLSLPLYPDTVRVTGIDISREMLARAQARKRRGQLDHVALHCMDAERISFADDSFDKVVAMYVASVAPDPVRLVDEMRRVCRSGGELYIVNHFMHGNLPINGFKRFMGRFSRQLGFRPDFSLEDFTRDAGLELAERVPVNLFGHWTLLRIVNDKRGAGGEVGGVDAVIVRHFRRPLERPYTRPERERVTLLFGGLSRRHDRLIEAALHGLGYRAQALLVPAKADFQAGKEFGNNGQCNPTYFTVGALINHLRRMRDEDGMPTDKILSDYVFATVGSCGPCRFGMYEAEYRLALRNAGFDGFRVVIINQDGDIHQSGAGAGLELNAAFFVALFNAIFMGDLLNAVASHIRPFETMAGSTDAVLERCLAVCAEALRGKDHGAVRAGWPARLAARFLPLGGPQQAAALLDQLRGRQYVDAMRRCRELIEAGIEVDYTRSKPIVKITGEFWAQTTEGDGNFRMFSFLESEGAEVLVEPVATWIDYTVSYFRQYTKDRGGLYEGAVPPGTWRLARRLRRAVDHRKQMLAIAAAHRVIAREYERLRRALGGSAHPLANQFELQRMGHPYYNSRSSGGEGYLEVAKNIYYGSHRLAHMVLSLKPFGCMPSTQSDGAQAAVLAHYPDLNFLPVETSGEGDINAYSRVQMALGQAKAQAREEFSAAIGRTGYTAAEIRAYVAARPALRRPLQPLPHGVEVVGRAANFVLHVARLMGRDPAWGWRRTIAAAAER